ncbi:MAG: leucine-rich repeat domain-containing protein, partial [Treponemataceae bacterium]|nr:leucine-rich repeat domain-containing protein [Treponemataceae bacterium]
MVEIAKKHGLIYSSDFKSVLGVDSESKEFDGNVPYGATHIEEDAFSCCSLEKISLPDSVMS